MIDEIVHELHAGPAMHQTHIGSTPINEPSRTTDLVNLIRLYCVSTERIYWDV